MLLDSDDEAVTTKACEKEVEFTDDEEEHESSRPYPSILQTLDLSFETGALHLAVLSSSILKCDQSFLGKQIVFVAACADNFLRLVILPLDPPPPSSNVRPVTRTNLASTYAENGRWGEKVFSLNGHNKASNSLTMTIESCDGELYYIIASHSHELNGRLLFWRTPFLCPSSIIEPFQSVYLDSPAKSISFNPSTSRPNHLLVAESMGVCRIYDYNGSIPQDIGPDVLSSAQGHWLLSLATDFLDIRTKSLASRPNIGLGRKTIADAKWIMDGCAILVLLNNGEWGIWNIECSSMSSTQGLLGYQGIKGGSKSEFNLSGYIYHPTKVSSSGLGQANISKFTPLTPGTRKSIEPFSSLSLRHNEGSLSIIEVPSFSSSRRTDEAILFQLGENFAVIPSITKYWTLHSNRERPSSLFSNDLDSQTIQLPEIDLQGEHCSAAALIPRSSRNSSFDRSLEWESAVPEVIVLAEHRFVILSWAKSVAPMMERKENRQKMASTFEISESDGLDVNNIEIALEKMEEKNRGISNKRNILFSSSPLPP